MEGDRAGLTAGFRCFQFQSTPSAWRETEFGEGMAHVATDFNPLPPHGGRPDRLPQRLAAHVISIHSLRMEGDPVRNDLDRVEWKYFNPLPPHGGRPPSRRSVIFLPLFQSTPSAWRETFVCCSFSFRFLISIHSLRMEGDPIYGGNVPPPQIISIHSLRMEGDPGRAFKASVRCYHFNPLPPHGGRPV